MNKKLLPIGETQESMDMADALSRLIAATVSMGPMGDTRIPLIATDIIVCIERYKEGRMSAEKVLETWENEAAYCIKLGNQYKEGGNSNG